MIFREVRIAAANGLTLGVLIGVGVGLIFGRSDLGAVIALAMLINNLIAGLSGILIPVTLDKLDVDPAVSSAVFVTMMTDVMGFFSFLGLATLWGCTAKGLIGNAEPGIGRAMPQLHMSKVAVSCASLETLRRRLESRIRDGVVPIVTRFMPKRADELVGGSIYWIIKHRIAARQTILGFDVRASDRRTIIRLDPDAGDGPRSGQARPSGLALSGRGGCAAGPRRGRSRRSRSAAARSGREASGSGPDLNRRSAPDRRRCR